MNIDFYITYSGSSSSTTHKINEYVVKNVKVPVTSRERDYSVATRGFDLAIPFNYSFATGEDWKTVDRVYVSTTNLNYVGVVKKRRRDFSNRTYIFTIFNVLDELKNYKVDYATLHSSLSSTGDTDKYFEGDYYGYNTVGLLYLIETMFDIAGLTSPITTINSNIAIPSKKVEEQDGTQTTYSNIYFNELKIDERMLYALNQHKASKEPLSTETNDDFDPSLKLTFFDFISWVCAKLSLVFKPTSAGEYVLIPGSDESYTITDDNLFTYKEEFFNPTKEIIWQIESNAGRDKYYSLTASNLTDIFWQNIEEATDTWYRSLMITPVDRSFNGTSNQGTMLNPNQYQDSTDSNKTVRNFLNPDDILSVGGDIGDRIIDAYESSYKKLEQGTVFTDSWKNVYQHFIDVRDETSIITQIS